MTTVFDWRRVKGFIQALGDWLQRANAIKSALVWAAAVSFAAGTWLLTHLKTASPVRAYIYGVGTVVLALAGWWSLHRFVRQRRHRRNPEPSDASVSSSPDLRSDRPAVVDRSLPAPPSSSVARGELTADQRQFFQGAWSPPVIPDGVLHLSWDMSSDGLDIAVTNRAADTIRGYRLLLCDVRKYDFDTKKFIETPTFYGSGPFVKIQLLNPVHLAKNQIGAETELFCGYPAIFKFLRRQPAIVCFEGRTLDGSMHQCTIQESGIWRVSLRSETTNNYRDDDLMFEWHDIARPPTPYEFPTPTSNALPPFNPLR